MSSSSEAEAPAGRRVALALGSGGARGYAHIGVLDVLHERGHGIVAVAGASMGALVGGVFAAGQLPSFAEWARELTRRDIAGFFDLAFSGPGLMRADRILDTVSELLDGARIEDLPIPYTAVATDIRSRRPVWFQHGPLDAAIRASISIPGAFEPIVINGRLLADGGLVNPVPIEPTAVIDADMTVAVSLTGMREGRTTAPAHASSDAGEPDWRQRLRAVGERLGVETRPRASWRAANSDILGELPEGLRFVDVVYDSLDTMTDLITRYRMASNPPDVLIEVPADACEVMDFHRADEMIALGRSLAERALDEAEARWAAEPAGIE